MFDTLERASETIDRDMMASHTLRASITLKGIGLHTGQPVKMTIVPAPTGTGILFRRADLLKSVGPAGQAADLERVSVRAVASTVTAT
ncbi:MAG: UDP-3-O-acyl-N-acetylglucosamine deacetylase, partial [Pseudomonadota bacterium]